MNSVEHEQPPAPWPHAPTPMLPGRPLLLIVDDEPRNIQLLYEIFKHDYEVGQASSGKAALEFCRARHPDLILLDIVMPEMDGYAVCQRLKSDFLISDIPVIFVTACGDPLQTVRGLDAGGVDFIIKPFHLEVVRARVRSHVALKRQSDALRSLAMVDGLTGVGNRRYFDTMLQAEWRRSIRSGQPLALIIADVDFFKPYNDRYGHLAGDACLQSIATVLNSECLRSHDAVARYGGEEFVCILPDTSQEGAAIKANELENAVRSLQIAHEASEVCAVVTISLGVAAANPVKGDSAADLVACADELLYFAKRSGRGQMKSLHTPQHSPERIGAAETSSGAVASRPPATDQA